MHLIEMVVTDTRKPHKVLRNHSNSDMEYAGRLLEGLKARRIIADYAMDLPISTCEAKETIRGSLSDLE